MERKLDYNVQQYSLIMTFDVYKDIKREPQIYRDIELYPIMLFDYEYYEIFANTMCIPKDYIPNKKIMKMSYLKYLLFIVAGSINHDCDSEYDLKSDLERLLEYITKKQVMIKQFIDSIEGDDIRMHYDVYIGDNKYTEYDFDMMREIILVQNGKSLEYIESFNQELEESLAFFNKSNNKLIPLKNRIYIYSTISNTSISEMEKWTYCEFEERENILKIYEEWKIYKPLEASGQISYKSSKDTTKSPFDYTPKSNDRYSEILINVDDMMKDTGMEQFAKQK